MEFLEDLTDDEAAMLESELTSDKLSDRQILKKLDEAIAKSDTSRLSSTELLALGKKYPYLARRIANKISAANPAKIRAVPSYMEDIINKVSGVAPAENKLYIGDKPEPGAVIEGIMDRRKIVETAATLTDRVSVDRLKRFADAIFNDGFSLEQIKGMAVLDIGPQTLDVVSEVFDSAAISNPTIEDAEAISAISRAILRHVMTHHKDKLATTDHITPFVAWRVKEKIVEQLVFAEKILVNPQGFDTKKQLEEFDQLFSRTEVVLWNKDIWEAATRKCEIFVGTILGKQLVEDTVPMFWQFERHFGLPEKEYFDLDSKLYYCAGFVILPHSEKHVEVTFQKEDVKHVEIDGHDFVELEGNKENIRAAITEAANNERLHFVRHGISIASVFMPLNGDVPEIRFMKPLYEEDIIPAKPAFYQDVLAALQFLSTKYVSKENAQVSKKELKADRHLFKQVRKGKVQVPPIKIINLRRLEKREHDRDPDTPKRHWSCHWFVEPHWHKYFHKSQDRWIRHYVNTYPKGDLTKPLKPPREKVFKAIR